MRRILRGTPSEQALGSLPAVDLTRARASLRLSALDARDRLRGRHDALIPPRRRDVGWCRRAYRGRRNFRFVVADEWIFGRLREHGLVLTDLHPGSWSGRKEHMHFQDVLVAVRDGA